ncbi:hypothetical protein ACFZC6_29190 [Streptomyces ossamyceticus]|uniref:hypothetical protein n=1 Tax=Streptomyces ossamyceticus TaxID=249581 RepID=UPI0036EA0E66
MDVQPGRLPEFKVRGWQLVLITTHGIRGWWHTERADIWMSGVLPGMSRRARQYAADAMLAANQGQPLPLAPATDDPVIPVDAWPFLIDLDVATLNEGDPL